MSIQRFKYFSFKETLQDGQGRLGGLHGQGAQHEHGGQHIHGEYAENI